MGQSPATWDRTHPRNLLQMTAKVNQGVNPRLSENGHTHTKLQPSSQTMSNQISGLISRYMTNSKPQDTTQTNTQSYGLLQQRGDQATVLDFSPERGDRSGSDERGDVQPSTRRGDDPRHCWWTDTPANGRSADPRDPTQTATSAVSNTARRTRFSSPG